jgi:hypothetical protein
MALTGASSAVVGIPPTTAEVIISLFSVSLEIYLR